MGGSQTVAVIALSARGLVAAVGLYFTQAASSSSSLPSAARTPAQSTSAEDRIAEYTLWLTIVTGGLAILTAGLLIVAYKQHGQIEREFISTHRPRVILRRVTFARDDPDDPHIAPDVKIEIANTGEGDAEISRVVIALQPAIKGPPAAWRLLELLQPDRSTQVPNSTLASGDSIEFVATPNDAVIEAFATNRVSRGLFSVYCAGYVEYADALSKGVRRTGFIRCGDIETRYFQRVDAPDFEYED